MWELDCEEGWLPKNWCFWTVVLLEKTLESPLDCKEIQQVHSKGDQPWDFFGRNDAKAETPVLWPPHMKSWLIGKDSDAGRDWGQEEKGTTEDEMAGWHHWLYGHKSEWSLGVGDRQGGLALQVYPLLPHTQLVLSPLTQFISFSKKPNTSWVFWKVSWVNWLLLPRGEFSGVGILGCRGIAGVSLSLLEKEGASEEKGWSGTS